jgi:hypothetical protein
MPRDILGSSDEPPNVPSLVSSISPESIQMRPGGQPPSSTSLPATRCIILITQIPNRCHLVAAVSAGLYSANISTQYHH